MGNDRKEKLIDLGAERLADALVELAAYSDGADELVERLIAAPKENIQRFKKKLAGLKRSRRHVGWKGVLGFSRELEMLLLDLKAGVGDSMAGLELTAAFYEADHSIFNRCDDSSGYVGDVFRNAAKELFVEYALGCADEQKVADIVLKLNRKNDYGVRDVLVGCAGDFLSGPVMRRMITRLEKRADDASDEYGRRRHLMLIESLARQLKDPRLFEKTRIASRGELSAGALIDIARVYLESGDVDTACSRLEKVPENEGSYAYERGALLGEIYKKQGDTEKLAALMYKKFKAYPSIDTLDALLDVIGHDERDSVILEETGVILERSELRVSDARFLIGVGKMDEAEAYLLKRADQLNGEYYGTLLPLAETLAAENRLLAAGLIFRCLLTSILERGYTKAYPHGIRYLKKLDQLALSTTDWKDIDDHEIFKDRIYQAHGRKRSFWSKYEVKK